MPSDSDSGRTDQERLGDIFAAAEVLAAISSEGRSAFDENLKEALHELRILGEAAGRLSSAFRDAHPALPFKAVVDIRNIVVHDYWKITPDWVWRTVSTDISGFVADLRALQDEV